MTIKPTVEDFMNPAIRYHLGKNSDYYFALIYFPHLFRFKSAKFQRTIYKDFRKLDKGTKKYMILCGYRESAKTTLSRIRLIKNICYKRRSYIQYVSFDKEAAKEALFDIVTQLQTNEMIIKDFGRLFWTDQRNNNDKAPQQRQQGNFVTTNGVRVTAMSINQSTRGKIHGGERPDMYVCDDFENMKTKRSAARTRAVIDFFKELFGGLSTDSEIIFLGNKISDTGSVQFLLDTAHNNSEWLIHEFSVVENYKKDWRKGTITWPSKFVMTDTEAFKKNQGVDPRFHVKSLESMHKTMNADGRKIFEQEMLCLPEVDGARFFDTSLVDERINVLKTFPKPKEINGWKIWEEPKKDRDYMIGADVAEGYGNDSSVIQIMDRKSLKQVAEFESSHCPPNLLAKYMVEKAKAYNGAVVCPERNSIGVAVVNEINNLGYQNMYREKTIDKISNRPVQKFGWHTNSKTKPLMLFDFKRDFEAGLIEIMSIPLLREMRAYTNNQINRINFDSEASNHWDRVVSISITHQLRNFRVIKGFKT